MKKEPRLISRLLSAKQQSAWELAYRKALKDYGNRPQAERIAWSSIGFRRPRKKAA